MTREARKIPDLTGDIDYVECERLSSLLGYTLREVVTSREAQVIPVKEVEGYIHCSCCGERGVSLS